jgi:hypothetical protein
MSWMGAWCLWSIAYAELEWTSLHKSRGRRGWKAHLEAYARARGLEICEPQEVQR